jgi:hypothetical protein
VSLATYYFPLAVKALIQIAGEKVTSYRYWPLAKKMLLQLNAITFFLGNVTVNK